MRMEGKVTGGQEHNSRDRTSQHRGAAGSAVPQEVDGEVRAAEWEGDSETTRACESPLVTGPGL